MSVETDRLLRSPRRRRSARVAARPLFAAMIVAAVAAFFVQPRVARWSAPSRGPRPRFIVAPAAFAIVVVIAALDAWRSAPEAAAVSAADIVVYACAVAFLGLLLPNTVDEYRARTAHRPRQHSRSRWSRRTIRASVRL